MKTNELYDLRKDSIRDDFDESSLRQLDNPKRNGVIVDQFLKHQAEYGKTLIFAINVAHAQSLVVAFSRTAPQVRVASILGTTDKAERARLVGDFKAGRIDVLINCKVFVEGFDCKDIQTIFLTARRSYKQPLTGASGGARGPGRGFSCGRGAPRRSKWATTGDGGA